MGELQDFQSTKRKKGCAIIVITFFLLIGFIIYFSIGEFKGSGFFRSGKSSNATELFQVFPILQNDTFYFASVEGIFKTTSYERTGGFTQRSGSTDIRLSLHALHNGEELYSNVVGDLYDGKIKIIGSTSGKLWMYDATNGLYAKSIPELKTIVTQDQIVSSNQNLQSGLAVSDIQLNQVDELFFVHETTQSLFVTTIDGKQIWIDANTFQNKPQPLEISTTNYVELAIDEIIEKAVEGEEFDAADFNSLMKIFSAEITWSQFPNILSKTAVGADSCTYALDGSPITTISKLNCPNKTLQKNKLEKQFINGKILMNAVSIDGNTIAFDSYRTPALFSLNDFALYIIHENQISIDAHLILSKLNTQTEVVDWQYDVSAGFEFTPELVRIYTLKQDFILIFKTHPELDDQFTCVAVDGNSGTEKWRFEF